MIRRRSATAGLVAVAAVASTLAGPALSASAGQGGPGSGSAACSENPEYRSDQRRSTPGQEAPDDMQWSFTARGDAGLSALGALAASRADVLGVMRDYPGRRAIVVYSHDAAESDIAEIRDQAQQAVGGAFTVHFEASCSPARTIARARAVIEAEDWTSATGPFTHVNGYDVDAGRLVWTLPRRAGDVVEQVRRELGRDAAVLQVVHTDGSPVTLTAGSNRLADTSPYWGGARIVISTSGCTSGFTMLQNTTRFLTTAGHCASGNGQNVTSGAGALIGTTSNRTLPNPDLMSIWPSQGQQHTNVIHTNGEDGAASRPVTSRIRNGVVNFCLSGSVSNSICTVTLVQDDVTICFPTGCTTNLYVAARNNNQVVRKGDSGGPAYGRDGSNASARGIIIGGNNNPDGTFAGTQVYMHNIGTLENQTGAGVAVF